jgi:hypothetical protein
MMTFVLGTTRRQILEILTLNTHVTVVMNLVFISALLASLHLMPANLVLTVTVRSGRDVLAVDVTFRVMVPEGSESSLLLDLLDHVT